MNDMSLLQGSVKRLLTTVGKLADDDFSAPSRLPGWTRAHVITHVARAADSRTGMLEAARSGTIGRQYASAEAREQAIEVGADRPAYAIRSDLRDALNRFTVAVAEHPEHVWDAPSDWLTRGRQPVRLAVPSFRVEVEFHHVDLDAGYGPDDWPDEFVHWQLPSVVESLGGRAEAPPITLMDLTVHVGHGGLLTVSGDPPDLLAWLTGRGDGRRLRTSTGGPLPALPPLS